MHPGIRVLNSKLQIPRTTETIERPRLLSLTAQIPKKLLTTVTAGAGYGKTTLVAQAVKGSDVIWYRLDRSDGDLNTFLSYLTKGIQQHYPEFVDVLSEEATLSTMEYESLLIDFLSELESVLEKDLIIVLDDYHFLPDGRDIRKALTFLMERFTKHLHIVIISRSDIDLPISRLRATRDILDITYKDLAFIPDEIKELFLCIFNIDLGPDTIQILHEKTQGWVSGLILCYHSLQGRRPELVEMLLGSIDGPSRTVFEYLEENVYALLHPQKRDFLIRTSILPRLSPAFCNKILGIEHSAEILNELERSHLFTFSYEDMSGEYYYHQLFQDFLRKKLCETLHEKEVQSLHAATAYLLEVQGEDEEAVGHYVLANEFEQAIMVLSRIGIRLLKAGKYQCVKDLLEKTPADIRSRNPWLFYIRAYIRAFSEGRLPEAIEEFQTALVMFNEQDIHLGSDNCENDLAILYFMQGDFNKAYDYYKKILSSKVIEDRLYVEMMSNMVFISAYLGKVDEADRYAKQALERLPFITDKKSREMLKAYMLCNQCHRYNVSGDFNTAIILGLQSKEYFQKNNIFRSLALACHSLSNAYCFAGNYSEGLKCSAEGLGALEKMELLQDPEYGWLLLAHSMCLLGLRNLGESLRFGQRARDLFQSLGSPWGEACANTIVGEVHIRSGNLAAAKEIINSGIELVHPHSLQQAEAPLIFELTHVYLLEGRYDEGHELMNGIKKTIAHSKVFSWAFDCLSTYLYWLQGKTDQAITHLIEGIKVCEANQYYHLLKEQIPLLLPLIIEIYARGEMQGYIQKILLQDDEMKSILMAMIDHHDARVAENVKHILDASQSRAEQALHISCLGKFKVLRGREDIRAEDWKSKKAKMLFKLLIHYRPHGYTSKEVFMEHLWPEGDPVKTAKRFHVAMVSLRKILEPKMVREGKSTYILNDGDSYFLDPGKGGAIDVEVFHEVCQKAQNEKDAEKAIAHLLNAQMLYQGDFLEEDHFESWCNEEREKIKNLYLSIIASIVDFYEWRKDYDQVVFFCNKFLESDPYAEDIYQRLMKYHALQGNNAMVKKAYERCRKNIMDNLGCPLNIETELLFKKLIT